MTEDHYFTAEPASADERRRRRVTLAGRPVEVEVAPGIFSADGIDKGTQVLLDLAPAPPPAGTFLDLGCGWGPIALTLALRAPDAQVHAVDVNARSLDLMRRNAALLGLPGITAARPEDLAPAAYDLIWSNPPIRIGKGALHTLLRTWLPRLAPDGVAVLVVAKNLGADSLARWIEDELSLTVTRLGSRRGFRVLQVVRPR